MSSDSDVQFRIQPAASQCARALIAALDEDILRRYPGLPVYGIDAAGFEADGGVFVIGYVHGEGAVCGALRPFAEPATVEVKRMFVAERFRRRALARRMLAFLEQEASRRGYERAILETAIGQPEAIALYASAGWRRTAPYGPFIGNPLSVCFEKRVEQGMR